MTKKELYDVYHDKDKRILKMYGYYYSGHFEKGKLPSDLEDVDLQAVKEIARFLNAHPMHPKRKRRKRINYTDTYYLGYSYGLKHVVERFLPSRYCANGDFIAACIEAGFIVVPMPNSPNAAIYVRCERIRSYEDYFTTV
jgi:hypothetical protein